MTQKEMVLRYMMDNGSISSMEAFYELGITRLAARVFELRKSGYNIRMRAYSSLNRFGKPVTYSRYWIEGDCDA